MSIGRKRQEGVYIAGLLGRPQAVPVCSDRLERAALAKLGRDAAAYFAGSAGLERTAAANRAAFYRCRIVQRVMRDVSTRDLTVELFGRTLPLPFLLGPIGVLEMAHRHADLPAARAASAAGIPFVTSRQASRPMEQIAQEIGDGPGWFQLYWSSRNELTASFVERAERAGYEAIVVTLDTTLLGWRVRDLERGYLPFLRGRGIANYTSDPVFSELPVDGGAMPSPPRPGLGALRSALELLRSFPGGPARVLSSGEALAAVRRFLAIYSRPDLTWDDLPFLRARTRLPILLKGIIHPDDADRAVRAGMDGVIVSNHGGRQVDGAMAALDALPGVVDAVAGRVPVLFDSGVRTGADIFKALCLGARAVLIGPPYIYGLALAGERGVADVIANLAAELDLTLGLAGRRSLRELDRSDIFEARLLGKRFYCVRGEDAARMFYEPDRLTRNGALPPSTLSLLQDKGSVATLDAEAHRHSKAMFMPLMTPARLDAMAGVPFDDQRARILTRQVGAMIDNASTVGPANWAARVQRQGAENYLRRVIEGVRAGRITSPEDSAAHVIAFHRDEAGALLPPEVGAVEMLNILRPTVAVARFMTFAVLGLHQHPGHRERVVADDAFLEAFVQEVRRISPFFPIIAGVARGPFAWRGMQFQAGDRFVLDLYGTDHDGRLRDDPEAFRPERFLGWPGNPFSMIPQGGGDHHLNHRCAGEWLTISVMKSMLRALARDIDYAVPAQDLSVSLSTLPALPRSGSIIQVRGVGA